MTDTIPSYIEIETIYTKDGDGKVVAGHKYKVFPEAIKDAVLEFMRNHRYVSDTSRPINRYYIELDRVEGNRMVAVIDQTRGDVKGLAEEI